MGSCYKSTDRDRKKAGRALLAAVLVLIFGLVLVFYHDDVNGQEEAVPIEAEDAVGFICGGNSVTGAVCIADDPYDGMWDVYLPGMISSGVKLVCDDAFSVRIGDTIYHNGDVLPVEAAGVEISAQIIRSGDKNTEETSKDGTFRFYEVYGVPFIFLDTMEDDAEEVMADERGNNEDALIRVVRTDGSEDYSGLARMRVHGNTTWTENKKSYNLHLEDEASLLDMGSQKKWVLVASQVDSSFLMNALMQTLASRIGEEYCPEWRYADVFLNGEYKGLYLLFQKIDISGGTVHIKDLEEENEDLGDEKDPEDITGGYILEHVRENSWESAGRKFETPNHYIEIKSPKNATASEVNYISTLVNRAEENLYAGGTGEYLPRDGWMDQWDEKSWIIQYLLQEISFNCDTEAGSQFFWVDSDDETIYGGPGWDFDRSIWLPTKNESLTYYVRSLHVDGMHNEEKSPGGKFWMQQMNTDPTFHEDMKAFYLQTAGPALEKIVTEDIPVWRATIQPSVLADCIRWQKDYDGALAAQDRVAEGFGRRCAFLTDYYSDEDAYAIVRFIIDTGRYDLLVPVKYGESIHEEVMPLIKKSQEWVQEDGTPFTADTIVTKDISVTVVPGEEYIKEHPEEFQDAADAADTSDQDEDSASG